MNKDYEFIAFDAQYFLFRNLAALKSRTSVSEVRYLTPEEGDLGEGYVIEVSSMTAKDLVKQFFWSIVKTIREGYSCSKVILLWDRAPYHKTSIIPNFKGDRDRVNQEMIDEFDIQSDPAKYLQLKEDYRLELIKQEAKYWIINELGNLGMPSVMVKGFEADDLACIFSENIQIINQIRIESTEQIETKKSAICSADSDWMCWINDYVDFISFNKMEAWNLRDVQLEYGDYTTKYGISIFQLKQFMDSTFNSHNFLQKTSTLGRNDLGQLWEEVQNKDYSHITDIELFHKNMESFEYWKYPNFDEAIINIRRSLKSGLFPTMDEYQEYHDTGKFPVSYPYFETYITLLDKEYYESTEENTESQVQTTINDTQTITD